MMLHRMILKTPRDKVLRAVPWVWIFGVVTLNYMTQMEPAPLSREMVIEVAQRGLKEYYERVFAYTNVLDEWHVTAVVLVPEEFVAPGFLTSSNGFSKVQRSLKFTRNGSLLNE